MSKPVRLAREARAELHEAARRYGEQRPELRIEFLAVIDETMERMVRLAKHLGSPPGIDPTLGIKRVFVKRFPLSAYFIDLPTRFRVLTVAHGRRRPFHPAISLLSHVTASRGYPAISPRHDADPATCGSRR